MMQSLLFLLLAILFATPAAADAWPDGTIGSGFGVAAKPERTNAEQLARIKKAGFSFIRYDMRWEEIEKQRGAYAWDDLDRFIAAMRKAGLKSVIILHGSNELYSEKISMKPEDNYGWSWAVAAPVNDDAVSAFVAFAVAAVRHFGNDDVIWEIWNEPDLPAFWPPKPDPAAFAKLAEQTCLAMRAADAHVKIIGPAVARLPDRFDILHNNFFKTFIQTPAKNCFDAISIHPYRRSYVPETAIDDYQNKVATFIEAYADAGRMPTPIVDSEWGYSTSEVSPEQQAAYAMRIRLADLMAGVPLTILYEWQDSAAMSEAREMHFGMTDADGQNKSGATLIEALLPRMQYAVIIHRIEVPQKDAFVLLLRQPNGNRDLVAWMAKDTLDAPYTLQVQGNGQQIESYPLTLAPQLFPVSATKPVVTVTKGAATPQ